MDSFRADFRAINLLDIAKMGRPVTATPSRKKLNDTEGSVLTSVASFGKLMGQPVADLVLEIGRRIPKDAAQGVRAGASMVPVGLAPGGSREITFAIGGSFEAFGVFGATFQTGVYGTTTPELGLFVSAGTGVFAGTAPARVCR